MTISLYNTLTRSVVPLAPIEAGHVRLYVCGMTTYDLCHLGHARAFSAFDVIVRWMRTRGLRVTYVRNITDIDDKIIKRSAERGVTPTDLTAQYIAAMHEDFAALGFVAPDQEPRATEYVQPMLDLIGLLEEKNLAYAATDGDVNFSVRGFPGYGKLSGKSLDDLRAGERVAVDNAKRDPLDFVLWKHAKPGEPQWASKWGPGRPGWHIECSAMARQSLGATLDIHGGGPDLVFPHHENEIAQSEGAYGETFANVWMHAGALRVGEEKMSKSLGNFFTIRDARAKYKPEVLRFFLVRSHYRSQIAYTEDLLVEANSALTRLYIALDRTPPAEGELDWTESHAQRFAAAMDDDFNTPQAMSVLFDLAGEVNRSRDPQVARRAARQLKALGGVLGLLEQPPKKYLQTTVALHGQSMTAMQGVLGVQGDRQFPGLTDEAIERRIEERAAAKKAKNFAEADRIRKELSEKGVILEDSAGNTTWRWK